MKSRAVATYDGLNITEVLNISGGMVLCLTEDDRYQYIPEEEINNEWRAA